MVYKEHNKPKETTNINLREAREPTKPHYEMAQIKPKQKSSGDNDGDDDDSKTDGNLYYNVANNFTKVDDNLNEVKGSIEPSYNARQISTNQMSKNDDDVKMDLDIKESTEADYAVVQVSIDQALKNDDDVKMVANPSYDVSNIKLDDNMQEVKKTESSEPTYDEVASDIKIQVNPSDNINDDLTYDVIKND